ncbi:MAG: hypothetical protein K6G40_01325 [Eubacterium sp.]|nr:hypothetical protein [Eubacterium sp.]
MAVYLGIDINNKYTQISVLNTAKDEIVTLSQTGKDEVFSIPVCICKKKGSDEWLCGFDAEGYSADSSYAGVWDLFDAAVSNRQLVIDDENTNGRLLFALYLQKLIMIAGKRFGFMTADKIIITSKELKPQVIDLVEAIAEFLPAPKDKVLLKSYKETFYYYSLKQKPELKHHDIFLYNYEDDTLSLYRLERNEKSVPKVVTVKEEVHEHFATGLLGRPKKNEEKDAIFEEIVKEDVKGRLVSVIYLVGEGFDGDWMNKSVAAIVKDRHAYVGKNLYSRGACYGCSVLEASSEWPYIYLGESKTKLNILLEVFNKNRKEMYTLISAGENWYETSGRIDVILDEGNEFDIILVAPDGSETKRKNIVLNGLKEREDRTLRLELYARPESQTEIYLKVTDKGFGEIFPSSGQVFEYRISI